MVAEFRTIQAPYGEGLEGVKARQQMDLKVPENLRYIQKIIHEDGIDIVVTMLPGLAQRIHGVRTILMDNTYKRVHDQVKIEKCELKFKEWEVVIFEPYLNSRNCHYISLSSGRELM
jgi:hypothetical protein